MDFPKSIRALYSGSKGKYECKVCLVAPVYRDSSQNVRNHIEYVHPRTVLAWVFRNVTESPEKLPAQGDDQDAGDDDDPSDSDAQTDAPTSVDMSSLPFTRKKLMEMNMSSINCDSLEDALNKIKGISKMPKQHYITCFFPCTVDGSLSIAVEQHRKFFSYPTKGHRQDAIRHVIENAIQLWLCGNVGDLKSQYLVDVSYLPKYTSMPVEFRSYLDFKSKVDIQNYQLCECVDLIVGDGTQDEDYKLFRTRLLGAKTIVDLHSILLCPYLTPTRLHPVYFCSCRLLCHYKKIDHSSFDTIVENLRKEWRNIAGSSSQHQISWMDMLRRSSHNDLILMLDTRVSRDGHKLEYNDLPASNHEFIYNTNRHINDKQVKVTTLEDLHVIMEALFHYYPTEIWEYMHIGGLNAYFGPEEYAYGLLSLVNKLTNRSDKNFYFSPLLQALKMCCIMLASFHNLHEKNSRGNIPFTQELQFAASEIESCIKGLQSSPKEKHNCLLIRISAYELKDVDIFLFKSIRIIVFALHLLKQLAKGVGIGDSILAAFNNTKTSFKKFSTLAEFQMQILSARSRALSGTTKLPSYDDICKIVGMTFIITDTGRSSFSDKINDELRKLDAMLREDP